VRVGVTGHQDIPPSGSAWIDRELRNLIAAWPKVVGVSSLAKGADQMFAERVLAAGGSLEAVIPCREYASAFAPADRNDFFALLALAGKVETLEYERPSEDAFLAAGQYVADTVDHLIAIWDGEDAKGRGGTADIVRYARSIEVPVTVLWPPGAGEHGSQG
jgi:hypothetical protein